jgi:hypothetical protein
VHIEDRNVLEFTRGDSEAHVRFLLPVPGTSMSALIDVDLDHLVRLVS